MTPSPGLERKRSPPPPVQAPPEELHQPLAQAPTFPIAPGFGPFFRNPQAGQGKSLGPFAGVGLGAALGVSSLTVGALGAPFGAGAVVGGLAGALGGLLGPIPVVTRPVPAAPERTAEEEVRQLATAFDQGHEGIAETGGYILVGGVRLKRR